ncbi:hypothetical protein MTO96_028710 [Rhipicephalus appendiculatus]
MQADQLYSLEDESSLTIPHIRGMTVPMAVASIRTHIAAIPNMKDRLRCLCRIYSCLVEKRAIGPWLRVRTRDIQRDPEDTPVICFFEEMESMSIFVYSVTVTAESTRICALARESSTPNGGP